ncbi:hypothetical protein BGZ97_013368 [Linnemannia gamsii]|uniref:Uncharacterized protein n=1 Tax=Linnemannia gamsii TaxID=64522 RepID=A0A9P6UKQ3_9FUNG|nr:hypothetical protein BGZ97_013368 [Linnemannia gamsii]
MQDNYVALVQSNENPTSIDTMTWSLISAWPRLMYYPQDYSPMVCQIDPQTGVFTMMSAFNLTDPDYTPDPSVPQRPSGGFQYNPQTSTWTDFSLSPDYLWGDVTDSFAVFPWPGTTTLVQANVGTTNTVSLGVMSKDAKGAPQFVNALNWTLDPQTYGYPTRLVYGNNVLYQFGTLLANNRTGKLDTIMTRIPLSGSLNSFMPVSNLQTYNASSMSDCAPGYLSTSFYKDILYVFCQGADGPIGPGPGIGMRFKDGPSSRDRALSPSYQTDIERLSGAAIQPISGNTEQDPFAFVVNAPGNWNIQSISLGSATLGEGNWVNFNINITAPYGDTYTESPNHLPAIIGGSVAGGLFLIAVILYFVLRKRWPVWRRKLGARIIAAMMKDDHLHGSDKDCINKIEDPSSSIDLDGRDKILVTEDMEEHGIDISTGYMREVGLEHHPRPAITTTMAGATAPTTTDGSDGGNEGSPHYTVASGASRSFGHAAMLMSPPTTLPYGQDYELTTQLPRQPQYITTSSTANNSSSSIWTESIPPLPNAHEQLYNRHQHPPTAPYIYTHSTSSLLPPTPAATAVSPIPFRSTGSPPIPPSISSKEQEAWSQVHGTFDSAPPYSQVHQEMPYYTFSPSAATAIYGACCTCSEGTASHSAEFCGVDVFPFVRIHRWGFSPDAA